MIEVRNELAPYISALRDIVNAPDSNYPTSEHSIGLSLDHKVADSAYATADVFRNPDLKYIIVVGIGGSNLGTKAVYDAVRGTLDAYTWHKPKMLFADTVSPRLIYEMTELLENEVTDESQVVINLISKSGATTESIANAGALIASLAEKIPNIASRVVVTTNEGSLLWNLAIEREYPLLQIPTNVGGRYSVLSPVGLFPLALADIDVESLRLGAREMVGLATEVDTLHNPSVRSAIIQAELYRKGIRINNTFLFNPELESLGKWYRQLMGESLGKMHNIKGEEVFAGITPIVSIGSTDLHSMAQLYFGGPRDKYTTLVYAPQKNLAHVPKDHLFAGIVPAIDGKDFEHAMNAIYGGVVSAYKQNGLPVNEVRLDVVSERTVGAYLQWKMTEMMYLAKLLNVNAFDQPNVEDYKQETRRLLGE